MTLSPYYLDKSIVNQLRSFFEPEEQWNIDFESLLSQVEDYDDEYYILKINTRVFKIHKVQGFVEEVEQ